MVKKERQDNNTKSQYNENIIEGRNLVFEAFESNITIEKLLVVKGQQKGSINKILGIAREKLIPIIEVDKRKLDDISEGRNHQGVIAYVTPYKYRTVEDLLEVAKSKNEDPFLIILDEIEDPHNLGSIIRTAEGLGAHGIIIPKRRSASVNATVYRTSAGSVNYIAVAKVTNISREIEELKKENIFVYGLDMDGKSKSYNVDFSGGVALVIGNEGSGLTRLVKERCDDIVNIPMTGRINSLNASVAAGILMYEVSKDR